MREFIFSKVEDLTSAAFAALMKMNSTIDIYAKFCKRLLYTYCLGSILFKYFTGGPCFY